MTALDDSLLERERELDAVTAAVGRAAAGEGGMLLVSGPAGIGKTALLQAVRRVARERELRVLWATASELDRDYPFGLVHQLLAGTLLGADAHRRERLLTGAAGRAAVVLAPAEETPPVEDATHAVLHGLYWLCANLAEEQPTVLVVDDVHWADRPSLRFLEFLARRLEGLPLLLVAAPRSGEDDDLLDALVAGAAMGATLGLAPLTASAAADLLAATLDDASDPAFVAAAVSATGGNPLLLRELARDAAERGLGASAADASNVAQLGSAGIAPAVRRRLATLGAPAVAVAQAVAILGEGARVDDVAALAGLDAADAAAAFDRLARAEVLDPERREFVHPLVRSAIVAEVPSAESARMHAIVARRLAARGARADEIAVHLLATEPAGDDWTAATLLAAARSAAAEGAGEVAVEQLRRALLEPPAARERAGVLLELGLLEAQLGEPAADERLAAALASDLSGDDRAQARAARARLLLLTDPARAMAELARARSEADDPRLRIRLESLQLDATFYDARLAGDRAALIEHGRGELDPSPALLAHIAVDAAYRGGGTGEVTELARRAIGGGALLEALGSASATVNLLALSLRHAEEPALAATLLDAAEAAARRSGSRPGLMLVDHGRAYWHHAYGSLVVAEAHAREGLEIAREAGLGLAAPALTAICVEVLVERGALEEAAALIDRVELTATVEASVTGPDVLSARAVVRRLQDRSDEAEADLRHARRLLDARGWRVPLKGRVTLRLAELLVARGGREEAAELLGAEEVTARAHGGHGMLGLVLLARARLADPRAVPDALRAAERELAQSALALDRARALHELGAALRRGNQRVAAREPLRAALDQARRLGAERLAGEVHRELLAAGARPRRDALSGPDALTPSERRVSDLAVQGLGNREIAEALWVTRKTVEVHLGNAYAKLGIRSRRELHGALG